MELHRFTQNIRDILRLAKQEADRLDDGPVCSSHLLVGIIKEGKCDASQFLKANGIGLREVRDALLNHKTEPVVFIFGQPIQIFAG